MVWRILTGIDSRLGKFKTLSSPAVKIKALGFGEVDGVSSCNCCTFAGVPRPVSGGERLKMSQKQIQIPECSVTSRELVLTRTG